MCCCSSPSSSSSSSGGGVCCLPAHHHIIVVIINDSCSGCSTCNSCRCCWRLSTCPCLYLLLPLLLSPVCLEPSMQRQQLTFLNICIQQPLPLLLLLLQLLPLQQLLHQPLCVHWLGHPFGHV
jgi:hypothetical protein